MPSDDGPPCPLPRLSVPSQARVDPTPDFMKYPYPETEQILVHLETLPGVKEETKGCIVNLLNYRAVRIHARLPRGPGAAVLVPLFVGRSGDLYVVLSRRSDALKAFAGDTALPGGKIDAQDVTVEDTARREAFEEIGLPQDKERVPLLCVMEPHLAKGEILVTPVVVLVLDHGLQPNLNSSEVTSIFAQPLISFLSSTPHLLGGRTADLNNPYHTFVDFPWSEGGPVRLHRFLTGREGEGVKPVFGLTAAILIKTATIGYGRTPEFEVQPPNAPTPAQQIAYALLTPTNPLRIACGREGIDVNKTAARLLRPPMAADAARMVEWENIRMGWKRLTNGDNVAADVSTKVNIAVDKERGSGSGLHRAPLDRKPGGESLQKRIQDHVHSGNGRGMEGLKVKMEEYEKQARECKEQAEENGEDGKELGEGRQEEIPDMAKLGGFLGKTRDMINERMEDVKSDEKKLAKARKTYPKIMNRVKKQLEARNEDGEVLFAVILREGQEGLKGSIEVGKEGVNRGRGHVNDGEVGDQGIERGKEGGQRGSDETKKYIDKGRDGHNLEQTFPKKASHHDAKL